MVGDNLRLIAKMPFRPHSLLRTQRALVRSTNSRTPIIYHVQQRRTLINQLSGITRLYREQMGHDLKRIGALVLLPPILVVSYIAACGFLGFVGTQVWLEHFAMRPRADQKRHKHESNASGDMEWGWEDQEDWSGGVKGGTDPSLDMLPRVAIRSAWLFNTWAGQMGQQNVHSQSPSSTSFSYIQSALLENTDRAYALAEQSLAWALKYIRETHSDAAIPRALLLRHADLLEHIATPSALSDARREASVVYHEMPRGGYERCWLALRIGGLCIAEGEMAEAVEFWKEALAVQPSGQGSAYTPAEERLMADTYLQLSALYSTDSRLGQAIEIQREALRAIDSFKRKTTSNPTEANEVTPEMALHNLYLIHRAAVLSIHAAEVHYAQTRDAYSTILQLDTAVEKSGYVARTLSMDSMADVRSNMVGPSKAEMATKSHDSSPSPKIKISPLYSESRALAAPATALLRDAHRGAMQALVLKGMLLETLEETVSNPRARQLRNQRGGERPLPGDSSSFQPDNLTLASDAYEQALTWAGTTLKAAQALGVPEQEVMYVRRRFEMLRRRIEKLRLEAGE